MDEDLKRTIALWRLSVLGPLISARLEHGDRQQLLEDAAERVHRDPITGEPVRLAVKTIEAWYYAYRTSGFAA